MRTRTNGEMVDLLRKAEDLLADAGYAEDNYLRAKGWKYTSETPGCVWLWEKTIPDGRTMLLNRSGALSAQASLDNDEESTAMGVFLSERGHCDGMELCHECEDAFVAWWREQPIKEDDR